MEHSTDGNEKVASVAIIGGGLVGALSAIYFSQRGWKVDIYERRPDMRLPEQKQAQRGRSINLALSERGLSALRGTDLGLENVIMASAVPMHSRMLHMNDHVSQISQSYSIHGEAINSVDRSHFNDLMLDAAEKCENVSIHFEHLLVQADFDTGTMEFLQGHDKIKVKKVANLIMGADGAYSKMRDLMMKKMRMNYQQEYIDTVYCELHMPPKMVNGTPAYALEPNHLHIWPRHTFMLIAIPDPNFTFTCTLFMPLDMFQDVNTNDKLMDFFEEYFNDAIPLLGKKQLQRDYFSNPRGNLVSIKTSPHHFRDRAVIVGDAAHAMVPFYGQGMNCGFQDIEVFHKVLDQHGVKPVVRSHKSKVGEHGHDDTDYVPGLAEALADYSEKRVEDAHAICDLAMYNHYELRSAVTSVRFLTVRRLERCLHLLLPNLVTPLYSMVSFSTIPYSQTIQRWRRQSFWLNFTLGIMAFLSFLVSTWLLWQCTVVTSSSFLGPFLSSTNSRPFSSTYFASSMTKLWNDVIHQSIISFDAFVQVRSSISDAFSGMNGTALGSVHVV